MPLKPATIARAVAVDSDRPQREKKAHRLGTSHAVATAATWRTQAVATIYADGGGYVSVTRDGLEIRRCEWEPECGGT